MRIAVCGSVAVVSLFLAVPALAHAQAAPPRGASPPGPPPPGYGPPFPGYGPPPLGYYAPPPADQERTAMNSLYVEGLGPAFFYSFNYERIISDLAIRAGIGYLPLFVQTTSGQSHASWLAVPIDINYIGIGSKKHIFEIGGGATVLSLGAGASSFGVDSSESVTLFFGYLNVGYR